MGVLTLRCFKYTQAAVTVAKQTRLQLPSEFCCYPASLHKQ